MDRPTFWVITDQPLAAAAVITALLASLSVPGDLRAQGEALPSDVSFTLRRSFLEALMTQGPNGRSVGARWTAHLKLGAHSKVHDVGKDCEMHVAGRMADNSVLASPRGIVAEPPNLCKERIAALPSRNLKKAWEQLFDDQVTGATCDVTGFPRIFSEHAAGGETTGSNPDHVVELHPVTGLTCDSLQIDFLPFMKVYPGMARITDASTAACLENRRLFVRQRGSGSSIRYEFLEQGAKGAGGRCGNFVVVRAFIDKEYLRQLSNGGDHVALVRAWVGEDGPFPLKIYTYAGTAEDAALAALLADPDEYAQLETTLHGLLTYDYFAIVRALQDETFQWLPSEALEEYREIRGPLAMVVFGTVP